MCYRCPSHTTCCSALSCCIWCSGLPGGPGRRRTTPLPRWRERARRAPPTRGALRGAQEQPREPRLRPGAGRRLGADRRGSAGRHAGRERPGIRRVGRWHGRRGWSGRQAPLPRLRFGPSRLRGADWPCPAVAAAAAAVPAVETARHDGQRKPGIFSGGSLVGGSPVRLRLGTGRRIAVCGRAPAGLSGCDRVAVSLPARGSPRRVPAPGVSGTGHFGSADGRFGSGASGSRRLSPGRVRAPARASFRGGPRSRRPRFRRPRTAAAAAHSAAVTVPRRAIWPGTRPTGAAFRGWIGSPRPLGLPRQCVPRQPDRLAAAPGRIARGGWLSDLRPRGGWSAIWRISGKRTGGFR